MFYREVNKELLQFKIHYFLRYGGISILLLLAPMAVQRGISPKGVGIIWTMNTLGSTICNVLVSTIADRTKSHRMLLLAWCSILAASFTTYFFLPGVPGVQSPMKKITALAECKQNETVLTICPLGADLNMALMKTAMPCNLNISDNEKTSLRIFELICNNVNQGYENINLVINDNKFCREDGCFKTTQIGEESKYFNVSTNACGKVLDLQCKSNFTEKWGNETLSLVESLKTGSFWLHALCTLLIYSGIESTSSLADTLCFVVLGKDRTKYGKQRMYGSLGVGLMGALMGGLVNYFSKDHTETNYTPAAVISATLLFFNLVFTTRINVTVPGKQSRGEVRQTVQSFSCICLMVTAMMTGGIMGIIRTFGFIYVREISYLWDPKFPYLSLLLGILIFTNFIAGEFPFMFLSTHIIQKFSFIKTFAMTLLVTSIRLLLMSVITNPWFFIIPHLLHGPSFGVFTSNMISYANYLAPQGAQATLLSYTMACFTIGRALGTIFGGLMMESLGGSTTFFATCIMMISYTIVFIAVNWSVPRKMMKKQMQGDIPDVNKNPTNKNKYQEIKQIVSEDDEKEILMKDEKSDCHESKCDSV